MKWPTELDYFLPTELHMCPSGAIMRGSAWQCSEKRQDVFPDEGPAKDVLVLTPQMFLDLLSAAWSKGYMANGSERAASSNPYRVTYQ